MGAQKNRLNETCVLVEKKERKLNVRYTLLTKVLLFAKCATCACMRTFKSQTYLVWSQSQGPVHLNYMPSPIIY